MGKQRHYVLVSLDRINGRNSLLDIGVLLCVFLHYTEREAGPCEMKYEVKKERKKIL